MPPDAPDFETACQAAVASLPVISRPWSRGWCGAVAGILEAAAAKPGNVSPSRPFPDLDFHDLVAAAIATIPAMEAAPRLPLGDTILAAVRAATIVARSNANLGIVLLVAPLATVKTELTPAAVDAVLAGLGPDDAAAIWEAIALARPGGLGQSDRWDLAGPPPPDIRVAMRHAADRDTIARLWAEGFAGLFAGPVADLARAVSVGLPLNDAILDTFLRQLAREPDSLIARRHGVAAAEDVRRRAERLVGGTTGGGWSDEIAAFDASLRSPNRLNPGTTADLVAAALYILLRDGSLRPALPFAAPAPFPENTR